MTCIAPSEPRLVLNGDVDQLNELLLAIADLDRAHKELGDYLALAKDVAAATMLAAKIKERIVMRDGIPYVARLDRNTSKTVCACHREAPWDCPNRRHGAIELADRPEPPTVKIRIIRIRSRRRGREPTGEAA